MDPQAPLAMVTATEIPKLPRIQALARASAIIDVIAASGEGGLGLSEISRATALNKTTAFNLIASPQVWPSSGCSRPTYC